MFVQHVQMPEVLQLALDLLIALTSCTALFNVSLIPSFLKHHIKTCLPKSKSILFIIWLVVSGCWKYSIWSDSTLKIYWKLCTLTATRNHLRQLSLASSFLYYHFTAYSTISKRQSGDSTRPGSIQSLIWTLPRCQKVHFSHTTGII